MLKPSVNLMRLYQKSNSIHSLIHITFLFSLNRKKKLRRRRKNRKNLKLKMIPQTMVLNWIGFQIQIKFMEKKTFVLMIEIAVVTRVFIQKAMKGNDIFSNCRHIFIWYKVVSSIYFWPINASFSEPNENGNLLRRRKKSIKLKKPN